MRLALAQLDALVGDLEGNGDRLLAACREAAGQGARLVLSPELSLWGYPPRDLLLRAALLGRQERVLGRLVEGLPEGEILRAAAETTAENAVDGLFAPLFWILVGVALQGRWSAAPGPLALAWTFKAGSTLDSMLGYRRERLRWLG
ncbi:MAG: cobalamin biosynthesis protein, partial [Cyanobium sp.]